MRKYGSVFVLMLVVLLCNQSSYQHHAEAEPVIMTSPFQPQYTGNSHPQSSIDHIAQLIGLSQFQQQYQTDGSNMTIALIDSGIDLGHSAFQPNNDGSPKVSIYRDFTEEGKLTTKAVSCYGQTVTLDGKLYHIGNIPNTHAQYRIAQLYLPNNSTPFTILITAHQQTYDHIYIDTNQNNDFTDEYPLARYDQQQTTVSITSAEQNIQLALTTLSDDGKQLQLSTDTLGHGTFLAGIIAANSTTYHGLAPNAQIAVYKIFDNQGQTSQYALAQAIEQALADHVDLINLSLSIPAKEYRLPRLTAAIAQAERLQIPIVAAVGNYGPATNTIAYPANNDYVIAVGSYQEPEMMNLNNGITLGQPFITPYSARATPDTCDQSFFVAPAAIISTVPDWYEQDYLYDEGTSISAAIVSGALLNLLQYQPYEHNALIAQLQQWAKNLKFPSYEQGNGAFSLGTIQPAIMLNISDPPANTTNQSIQQLDLTNPQSIHFSIPQGQTKTWYLQIPSDKETIDITIAILRQEPKNSQEHLIALGRCKAMLFDSTANLIQSTPSIGATYSNDPVTTAKLSSTIDQAGTWQLTVTSDPYLSQYNHLISQGWITIQTQ